MRASSQGEHTWSVAAGWGKSCHIGAKPRLTQHGETMGMSPPAASSNMDRLLLIRAREKC
jgi:hypothetical protein